MNDTSFDDATRLLAARWPRRWIGIALAGSVVGGVLGIARRAHTDAKKKRKKRKKKKKRKAAPSATVRCDFSNGRVTARRFAQTFIAPLSGSPTRAEVVLARNPDDFVLTFEIRTVLASGFPSLTVVFASSVVSDIPETVDDRDPPRRVGASFADVTAPLLAGQPYALVVTSSELWQIVLHSGGNACPGGKLFFASSATGSFLEHSGGDSDMVFALTITG